MPGAIGIVLILLLFPIVIIVSGLFASTLLGFALQRNGEHEHADSEMAQISD